MIQQLIKSGVLRPIKIAGRFFLIAIQGRSEGRSVPLTERQYNELNKPEQL